MATGLWTKEQVKLAFHLYCQLPYGRIHGRNPEIIALAKIIGRTSDAVAMKMLNIASNDPVVKSAGKAPSEPQPLSPAPRVIAPSADPRYVNPGDPVRLVWTGLEPTYHLEVLSIDSDIPVMSLDIPTREYDLRLNWLGTFRWRVAGRTGAIESQASGEGLICVVEK